MADIRVVWNSIEGRGDWALTPDGQLATGNDLETALLVSLFTDRVVDDATPDRRGWWADTFETSPIGSRLWQLKRSKIVNRGALQAEARDMIAEATQWMLDDGIVGAINIDVQTPPAGPGVPGTALFFVIELVEPSGASTTLRALWDVMR